MATSESRPNIQIVVCSALDGKEVTLSVPMASRHPSELVQKIIAKVGNSYVEQFRIELKTPYPNIQPVLEYCQGWEVECSDDWAGTWLQRHVTKTNAMDVLAVVAGLRVTELYPLLFRHCIDLLKSTVDHKTAIHENI